MGDSDPSIAVGNKVLFVGGPEAGNVRVIPESHGDLIMGDHDFCYKIWPIRMQGASTSIYFAYAADQHPIQLFLDMWRDYSPAAQIRGEMNVAQTYQQAGKRSP